MFSLPTWTQIPPLDVVKCTYPCCCGSMPSVFAAALHGASCSVRGRAGCDGCYFSYSSMMYVTLLLPPPLYIVASRLNDLPLGGGVMNLAIRHILLSVLIQFQYQVVLHKCHDCSALAVGTALVGAHTRTVAPFVAYPPLILLAVQLAKFVAVLVQDCPIHHRVPTSLPPPHPRRRLQPWLGRKELIYS